MDPKEDKTTLDAIHRLMLEVAEVRGKMKTIRDQLKDVMEQNDEYRAIAEELEEVKGKRQTAKKLLEADKDYQVVNSELEELKFQYKDLQEIMSHHLVTYFSETQNTQITDDQGETRSVILKATIGKPEAVFNDK
jgi:predicted  nucleic acid-binding Zn-ribbon protein